MSQTVLEELVSQIREAAANEDASSSIRMLMQSSQSKKDEFADAIGVTVITIAEERLKQSFAFQRHIKHILKRDRIRI